MPIGVTWHHQAPTEGVDMTYDEFIQTLREQDLTDDAYPRVHLPLAKESDACDH